MIEGSCPRSLSAPLTAAAIGLAAIALILLPSGAAANDAFPRMAPGAGASASPKAAATGPATVTIPATSGAAAANAGASLPSTERGSLSITVDRAKVIRLPERTQTVVVGNPAIADLSVQKSGIVVVTGKSFGVTNLIALDGAGNMLAESTVSVGAPTDAIVVVQRGLDRQSYSCTPSCQPSISLGDANTYFNENRGQAEQRNQFATSR